MKPSKHLPFYLQMIGFVRNGFALLDGQGREEVLEFVLSQQNPDGGFQDRGGRSDLYYSLFGGIILEAKSPLNPPKGDFEEYTDLFSISKKKFEQFISKQNEVSIPGFIERCCQVLLQKDLKVGYYLKTKSLVSLGRAFWKERYSINLSYRSFVLFLTVDAVLPFSGMLKIGAKKMLFRTLINEDSPCSEIAAKVFLLKMLNQDGSKDQEFLKSFACETGGFKAFQHLQNADLLSTAVALFSLKSAGTDLRLIKPACFDFIQQNYADGAFLSGDGDQTKDLEYTFYGLLALGVLGN